MKKGKKKRDFTIAELMVVIMIIAILAAVTVPVIRARIRQVKWSEEPQQTTPERSQDEICEEHQPRDPNR